MSSRITISTKKLTLIDPHTKLPRSLLHCLLTDFLLQQDSDSARHQKTTHVTELNDAYGTAHDDRSTKEEKSSSDKRTRHIKAT